MGLIYESGAKGADEIIVSCKCKVATAKTNFYIDPFYTTSTTLSNDDSYPQLGMSRSGVFASESESESFDFEPIPNPDPIFLHFIKK